MKPTAYDVAVLGSGIGGSVLAAILGRQGFPLLLLEKGTHPRRMFDFDPSVLGGPAPPVPDLAAVPAMV